MYLKKTIYNNSVKQILLTNKIIEEMANHLIGKKLSAYRESFYDADGDGKVTLKDFIHRIKNLVGADTSAKIPTTTTTTTTTTGSGY
tara:strand:+ start:3291 stop:3551 length:261 start_codon:yes stop_codon:yes gene_type:complete